METVLREFRAVPGVVGAMLCTRDGQLLAHSFPPAFPDAALLRAARTLADGAVGLGAACGPTRSVDFHFSRGRVVTRVVNGASLLLLCAPDINVHLLEMFARVAAPKLEQLMAEGRPAPPPAAASAPAPAASPAPARAAPPAVPAGRGKLHALVQRIEAAIAQKKLDRFAARGEIALLAGFSLGVIDAETPDDPERLAKLQAAAQTVLGHPL